MIKESFNDVSRVFQGCYKCFKGVSGVFQGCLESVSRVFRECLKSVSRVWECWMRLRLYSTQVEVEV